MWTCPVCSREFKRKNQSHYCKPVNTVGEYIAQFSQEEQEILDELRKIIKDAAPEAEEIIRWEMPSYIQNGNIVHFAMHKKHIGLYVGSSTVQAFEKELENLSAQKERFNFQKSYHYRKMLL